MSFKFTTLNGLWEYPSVLIAVAENIRNRDDNWPATKSDNLASLFYWKDTPEGHDFWLYVHHGMWDKARELQPHLFLDAKNNKANTLNPPSQWTTLPPAFLPKDNPELKSSNPPPSTKREDVIFTENLKLGPLNSKSAGNPKEDHMVTRKINDYVVHALGPISRPGPKADITMPDPADKTPEKVNLSSESSTTPKESKTDKIWRCMPRF